MKPRGSWEENVGFVPFLAVVALIIIIIILDLLWPSTSPP